MKPIRYKDTELLNRFPVDRWFAAGAYSVHASKLSRLVRLGILQRRPDQPAELVGWRAGRLLTALSIPVARDINP